MEQVWKKIIQLFRESKVNEPIDQNPYFRHSPSGYLSILKKPKIKAGYPNSNSFKYEFPLEKVTKLGEKKSSNAPISL
jgi:hypothetical protein